MRISLKELKKKQTELKVCFISYYPKKDYPRRIQLIQILKNKYPKNHLIICNSRNGIVGYLEIIFTLIKYRIKYNPSIYILGFRGNEIFLPVRFLSMFKTLHFDAFVPLWQAFKLENKWNLPKLVINAFNPFIWLYEYFCLLTSQKIYTDTLSHKKHYIKTFNVSSEKFVPIYLGCPEDMSIFLKESNQKNEKFTVFTYATMQKLHGLPYLLEAIRSISKKTEEIEFIIAGGNPNSINQFIKNHNLPNVEYYEWLEKDILYKKASASDLCLGGPFGGTPQSDKVITGKTYQFLKLGKPTVIGINQETKFLKFTHQLNCLLVEQKSSKEIEKAILWSCNNKNSLKYIGLNGLEFMNSLDSEIKFNTYSNI